MPRRQLSELTVIDLDGGGRRVVLRSADHIEAPNWSPDGLWLLVNSVGRLLRVPADGRGPVQPVPIDASLFANNDHVLSPDGSTIYFSVRGGHVYAVPWQGGAARRVASDDAPDSPHQCFVHGISPDGSTLVYVAILGQPGHRRYGLYTIPAAGGPHMPLLLPDVPVDGPEYTPDGRWVYYNGEDAARAPGHAQIYRMPAAGGPAEQLTRDARVNWFPHCSPDGRWVAYVSYPAGTLGHPANREVVLRVMRPDGGGARDVVALHGGQGTLNVNSWAPDSRHFAYVAYPMAEAP